MGLASLHYAVKNGNKSIIEDFLQYENTDIGIKSLVRFAQNGDSFYRL